MIRNELGRFSCADGLVRVLYQDGDLIVRTSRVDDTTFIDGMQKDNSYAVGFIQRTIWDRYVFGGERNFFALVCEKNDDPVGYALITPGRVNGYARIQQIAVREDARRLEYGTALISVVREFCNEFGRIGCRLRCRRDLESNLFWKSLGFRMYGIWERGRENHVGFTASDDIHLWEIDLNDTIMPLFLPDDDDIALLGVGGLVGTVNRRLRVAF